MKRCTTILNTFHGGEQLVVIRLVTGTAGIASGINTGCSVQRIDRKA